MEWSLVIGLPPHFFTHPFYVNPLNYLPTHPRTYLLLMYPSTDTRSNTPPPQAKPWHALRRWALVYGPSPVLVVVVRGVWVQVRTMV